MGVGLEACLDGMGVELVPKGEIVRVCRGSECC